MDQHMMEAIALALVSGLIIELRVAVHRFSARLADVETEQKRMKMIHVLPAIGVAVAVLLLSSCASGPRVPLSDGGSGASQTASAFAELGRFFLWTGGVGGALAFLGFAFSFGNPGLATLGKLAIVGIEAAGALLAVGGIALWIADNPWTLLVAAACVGLVWLWYRWPSIQRWMARRNAKRMD